MAIYNLDNIIDTIVEASSPAAPAGLQMLEAFKKFKHKAKKQKLAKFIEQLDSLSSFLKTRAKEGMNQFFAKFTEYRGRAPAEIYTTPGLVQVAISFLYDKDGMSAFIQHYGQLFNLQAIEIGSNRLRELLRDATDPEGKRDQKALEQASSDAAAYKTVTNEDFENDPVNSKLMLIKDAYQKLRQDIINLTQAAKNALKGLDADVIEQGRKLVNAASQGVEIGGRAAQRAVKDIGDVVKPFDPRLGDSPADAVRARQRQQAGDYFQNAAVQPAPPDKKKFKPMTPKQHEAYLAAQAARGNYSESIVDQVANMLTEDPDIIIS